MTVTLHKLTKKQLDSLRANCDTSYTATFHGGTRSASDIDLGVIHCTESDVNSAKAIAEYFAGGSAGGSTQLVVDSGSCYRTLDDLHVPYGAPPMNINGFHIEQCGYTNWTHDQWMAQYMTIHRCAYKMAVHAHKYNFQPVWLSVSDLVAGKRKGVTSHNNISLAFHATDHTDPGPNYPYDYFNAALKYYYKQGH